MTQVYQCTSPSFSMLNASLTNNIGVNLLCYFTLLFYFIHIDKKDPEAEEEMEGTERPHRVSVSKRGLQFLLEPQQIVYVETSNNCVVLHTEKGKFVKYQSLKSFSNELCSKSFRRVHRSYLVNAAFVEHIQKNHSGDGRLYLSTGDQIRFSRTYQEEVRQI
ncbi:LytR/AlgR family response regulator transcription factor [Flagellimonas nanhaiensis]|nr:LytTR family DNA-binding domain-containing protein [Allomuricauda nanhaiensis]